MFILRRVKAGMQGKDRKNKTDFGVVLPDDISCLKNIYFKMKSKSTLKAKLLLMCFLCGGR